MMKSGNAAPKWKGAAATATLQFIVDSAGRVDSASVTVLQTSDSAYATVASAAVRKWRFTPARLAGGCPVKQYVQMPVVSAPSQRTINISHD